MTKKATATTLQWSLLMGAGYFAAIALAHTLDFKIPGLFIYFNVPSHPYQDHIISFLAFGWAAFYFVASIDPINNPLAVKAVLLSSTIAIIGLFRINALDNIETYSPTIIPGYFWLQTLALTVYVGWLFLFYLLAKRQNSIYE